MTATVRGIAAGSMEGTVDVDGSREYTVIYYVQTDNTADGPLTVRTAFGIPDIGDIYSRGSDVDTRAIVVNKRARQRDDPYEWEVEVTYSTRRSSEPDNDEQSPLDEPPNITYETQQRRVVVPGYYNTPNLRTYGGQKYEMAVVNTAGEAFDPQPEYEVSEPKIVIERNVSAINPAELLSLADCVNESSFWGFEARQLKLMAPRATSVYDPQFGNYWRINYELVYRWETWDLQILNQGTYSLYNDGGTYLHKPFKTDEGHPRLGLLDENGYALNAAAGETWRGVYKVDGDDVYYVRLRVYREVDFNSLGIL